MINETPDSRPISDRVTSNKRERSWDDRENDRKMKSAAQSDYMIEHNSNSSAHVVINPTIHVSNLHVRIAEPHLLKLFQKIGPVTRVHLHQNKNHLANYAFVEFSEKSNAQKALETFDGTMLLKMPIRIRPAKDRTIDDHHDYKKESTILSQESKESLQSQSRAVCAKIEAVKRSIEAKKHSIV